MSKNPFSKIMEQAKKMQASMETVHKKLARTKIIGRAGIDVGSEKDEDDKILVEIHMNGHGAVIKVYISPGAYKQGKEVVEELVAAAYNDGRRKMEELSKRELTSFMPTDMNLPFMPGDEDQSRDDDA